MVVATTKYRQVVVSKFQIIVLGQLLVKIVQDQEVVHKLHLIQLAHLRKVDVHHVTISESWFQLIDMDDTLLWVQMEKVNLVVHCCQQDLV